MNSSKQTQPTTNHANRLHDNASVGYIRQIDNLLTYSFLQGTAIAFDEIDLRKVCFAGRHPLLTFTSRTSLNNEHLETTRHQDLPSTMSTPARPSTPVAQTPTSTPQTGTWRHPKMDEIVRRQNATSFTDRNMRNILYNVGGIVTLFFIARSLWNAFVSPLLRNFLC